MEARKTVYTDVVNGYYDGGSSSCYRECRPRSSANFSSELLHL